MFVCLFVFLNFLFSCIPSADLKIKLISSNSENLSKYIMISICQDPAATLGSQILGSSGKRQHLQSQCWALRPTPLISHLLAGAVWCSLANRCMHLHTHLPGTLCSWVPMNISTALTLLSHAWGKEWDCTLKKLFNNKTGQTAVIRCRAQSDECTEQQQFVCDGLLLYSFWSLSSFVAPQLLS